MAAFHSGRVLGNEAHNADVRWVAVWDGKSEPQSFHMHRQHHTPRDDDGGGGDALRQDNLPLAREVDRTDHRTAEGARGEKGSQNNRHGILRIPVGAQEEPHTRRMRVHSWDYIRPAD